MFQTNFKFEENPLFHAKNGKKLIFSQGVFVTVLKRVFMYIQFYSGYKLTRIFGRTSNGIPGWFFNFNTQRPCLMCILYSVYKFGCILTESQL